MFSYRHLHMDTRILAEETYIHQLCVDIGYHLEDLPRVIADTIRW